MQCKDIPDRPVLEFLAPLDEYVGAGWHDLQPRTKYIPTVRDAMPEGVNDKLVIAKMGQLIKRGLVDGCTCGCRGDFTLTASGRMFLAKQEA